MENYGNQKGSEVQERPQVRQTVTWMRLTWVERYTEIFWCSCSRIYTKVIYVPLSTEQKRKQLYFAMVLTLSCKLKTIQCWSRDYESQWRNANTWPRKKTETLELTSITWVYSFPNESKFKPKNFKLICKLLNSATERDHIMAFNWIRSHPSGAEF